jgi:hypothetical protein
VTPRRNLKRRAFSPACSAARHLGLTKSCSACGTSPHAGRVMV